MIVTKLKTSAASIVTTCLLATGAGLAAPHALQDTPAAEQRKADMRPETGKTDTPKTEEAGKTRKDYYGDPLPPGVLARMGTVQLRQPYADVRFAPDGKTLISAGGDGLIGFWDVSSGKLVDQKEFDVTNEQGYRSDMGPQTLSADGTRVVVSRGTRIQVFDVKTGKKLWSISLDKSSVWRAAISPDGKIVAAQTYGGKDPPIYLWDATSGKELHVLTPKKQADNLAFSPNGKLLGAASRDAVQFWSTETGAEEINLKIRGGVDGIVFSPDSKSFATSDSGALTLWDTASGEKQASLKRTPPARAHRLAFSRDGSLLAAGDYKSITIWDVAAKKEVRQIPRGVGWLDFSPDGKTLAASWQSCIDLWDLETGKPLHERQAHRGQVYSVAASPDGSWIASMDTFCHELRLWNVKTGKPSHAFDELNIHIRECVFSSDGKRLFCAKDDNTVRLWDVATGKEAGRFSFDDMEGKPKAFDIQHFRLSSDGKRLVAVGTPSSGLGPRGYEVVAWDVATGRRILAQEGTGEFPRVMSPDGNLLVSETPNGLEIRDTWTGKIRATYSGEVEHARVFSPDSKILAITTRPEFPPSEKGVYGVRLVNAADGKVISLIKTDEDLSSLCAFSADGRMFATSDKNTIRIWKVSTGTELFTIKRPADLHAYGEFSFVTSLAFLPYGKALATGMMDSTVLVWDLSAIAKDEAPDLDAKTLATLWSDLSEEPPKAYQAIWALGDSPKQAMPFLRERLKPVEEVDPKQIQRLLTDLDSDQFATREEAAKELAKLGERVHPALRKFLEGQPSEEVRTRLKAILEEPAVPSGETLRTLRAIQVLERIGTVEAQEVLKKLATGAEAARETQEAKDALARLSRGTASSP
jgi:WD40 repeat protein